MRRVSLIDKGRSTDTPVHGLLCGTWVLCVRHLNNTRKPVQPCGFKRAKHRVSDLRCTRNGNRGSLPEHLRNSPGWDLAWAAASPGTVLCWPCLALALPFSEIIPPGKYSHGVRSMSHWAIPRPPAVPECLWAPTVLAETPLPWAMEGLGSPALIKLLEAAISVCTQTEQRSIMPNGNWQGGAGQERRGCKALDPAN